MSSTKPTLDTTLLEYRHWPAYVKAFGDVDVGIEVELEGALMPFEEIMTPKYWHSKADGSLKHGLEFVLGKPINIKEVPEALKEFSACISKLKPQTSIRTSTHVHVNVLQNTLREIYNSMFFYYLIEELVIRTQPRERIGNLFCLRMSDAATIPFYIGAALDGKHFEMFHEDAMKYSALNLCTVNRLGTLEFRLFQATWDTKELHKITKLCHDIVRRGSKFDIRTMLDMYDDMPVKAFLYKMLPSQEWLYQNKASEYLNELLHTNYDRLRDLVEKFENPQFLTLPRNWWEDDTDQNNSSYTVKFDEFSTIEPGGWDAPDQPWPTDPFFTDVSNPED